MMVFMLKGVLKQESSIPEQCCPSTKKGIQKVNRYSAPFLAMLLMLSPTCLV